MISPRGGFFAPAGGRGVVFDPRHQTGASAAAAAGGSAGGSGERQRSSAPGETHQHHPGPHGRAPGLCLHPGQLYNPADEDSSPGRGHHAADPASVHPVEAVGLFGAVGAAQLKTDSCERPDQCHKH